MHSYLYIHTYTSVFISLFAPAEEELAHICTEIHTSLSSPPPADGQQRIIYIYINRRIHLVVCTAGK